MPPDWRKGSVAYTSPPLGQTLLAYGPASADLWISATGTDADVQVTLAEVRPDGQEMFVQRGWLRLSDRAQDDGLSTELRPFPIDRPETMATLTPDVPVLGRVELNDFAHAFRAGSRIRIWIDTPSAWGGYGFAPASLPSTSRPPTEPRGDDDSHRLSDRRRRRRRDHLGLRAGSWLARSVRARRRSEPRLPLAAGRRMRWRKRTDRRAP